MIINNSDIFGFIGAFFLIIRLLPLLKEQLNKPSKLNIPFLIIEYFACIFLGVSAILLKSISFIIANSVCFLNLSVLLLIQFKLRTKQFADTPTTNSEKQNEQAF